MKLHHIGFAVKDISVTSHILKDLFDIPEIERPFLDKQQRVNETHLKLGDIVVQLTENTAGDSPIAKFLKQKGEGLHHLCFEVDDLDAAIEHFKKKRVTVIVAPFIGAFERKYAFLSPSDTGKLLIELVEKAK